MVQKLLYEAQDLQLLNDKSKFLICKLHFYAQ